MYKVLSDDTCEFIKGEVVALFKNYNVDNIPIDGLSLTRKMEGVSTIPYSMVGLKDREKFLQQSLDGFVYTLDGGNSYTIYYNDDDTVIKSYGRRNMTIFHEIGHIVLDHGFKSENREIEELEANFFAKYALSPPPLVNLVKPKYYSEIADYFGLSKEASIYSWIYYTKWLNCKGEKNTEREHLLISLFETNIKRMLSEKNRGIQP